ncbi:MAG: hypothetical protein GPJ54_20880 [Candidatus Heimdallarchaeota archaeon]|nr:hypothetical protein [Candidatus Heimdallarchaeota archaeon]
MSEIIKLKKYISYITRMSVLESAKSWAVENLKDEDTVSILLVGSWAEGSGTDVNDIDIIVIKQFQLMAIAHQEHKSDNFTLDIWVYDKDSIKEDIYGIATDLNQINNTSMILSFLPNAIVWYESDSIVYELQERASKWSWPSEYSTFLEFQNFPPTTPYLLNAYNENLQLIAAAKVRLSEGKPVSHRRKDYPELILDKNEEKALRVHDLTENAYLLSGIDRHWTEFDDGRKAIQTGHWANAVASLKDVLRFIVRYQLLSVPEQLLDPSIWKAIEEMTLSDELKAALEEAYT